MNQNLDKYYTKFDEMAHKLGIEALKSLVPFNPERIRAALDTGDQDLKTLNRSRWASRNMDVQWLATSSGYKNWNVANTVCLLKHVATEYLI